LFITLIIVYSTSSAPPNGLSGAGHPRGEKLAAALTLGYPKRHFVRAAPRHIMDTTWR